MRVGDGRVMFIKGKLMPSDTEYEVVRTIVQCKDCKYWGDRHCVRIGKRYQCDAERTGYLSFLMDADDFCSRGVKR